MKSLLNILSILPIVLLVLFSPLSSQAIPNVTLSIDEQSILVNHPFTLKLTLSWEGEADLYLIAPPQLSLSDTFEQKGSSFSSITSENQFSLHYTYTLCAHKVGEHTINPIVISYWKKGDTQEEKINTEELHIHVSSPLKYMTGKYLLPAVPFFVFLGLFTLGFVLYQKAVKRRKTPKTVPNLANKEIVLRELEECYALKIKGEWGCFLKKAISLRDALILHEDKGAIMGELDTLLERVLYGGYQPTVEEMNLVQRELEKAIKNSFPETKDKE